MKYKYKTEKTDNVSVRMPMTPNDTIGEVNPRYEVQVSTYGGQGRMEIARFDVRPMRVGYAVRRFPYSSQLPSGYPLVGFAFTAKGADKLAHKKALSLAQIIAHDSGDIPVKDLGVEDLKTLMDTFKEKGWDKPSSGNRDNYSEILRRFAHA